MITILRGPAAALDARCGREAAASDRVLPLFPPASPRCWNGIRNLLAGVARHRGRGFVDGVLARRPAASSLVPGWYQERFKGELSDAEERQRELFAARPESHLSHNLLIQRPFFSAWAEILHELTAGGGFTLQVSDLARLDRESLVALRAFYRRYPDTAPDLVVGHDPRRDTPAPDADGLVWESPADDVWRIALGFRSLPGARAEEVGEEAEEAPPLPALDDGGIDSRAFSALASSPGPPGPEVCALATEAIRTAFRCFGFTTVLRLGRALLDRGPELTPEQTAEVHGLIGLAAHNRQFFSRGNLPLAELVDRHFQTALAAERDPARRSCLCYRLAVTYGRRKGDPDTSLRWARQAVEEADAPGLPPLQVAHLKGWAHNIGAFALLRAGRMDEAESACETAFSLLDQALAGIPEPATAPDQLVREAAFTHSLLADNLAALARMAGDRDRLAHWKEIADRLGEHFPGLERFEAATWIEIFRGRRDLRQALDRARHGLEDAKAAQDALREYEYEIQAGDLLYRLGEAGEAYAAFERARDLRRRLGSPRFLLPVEGPAAAAAARAGRDSEARTLFEALLHEAPSPGTRAQILAALGELAARSGQGEEADGRINEAIAQAVESGERDALLAVAVAAGRACQVLDRPEQARDAYGRALGIAEAGGPDLAPPPAFLLWAALLGAWETDGRDPQLALRCLPLASQALEDADAWWDLPRLLAALPPTAHPLEDLLAAASQRADCAALLTELREAAPPSP